MPGDSHSKLLQSPEGPYVKMITVAVTWSTFAHSENRVIFQKPAHNTRLLSKKRAEGWTEGGIDQGRKEWQERKMDE